MKELSREELIELVKGQSLHGVGWTEPMDEMQVAQMNKWLARGDSIAVYANQDLGHSMIGHVQFISYGSKAAYCEQDEPWEQLPDTAKAINWRYRLAGTYRGIAL